MPAARGPDPAAPLWRAAQVFRLLSCIYALYFQIAINGDLDRPAVGWALFAVLDRAGAWRARPHTCRATPPTGVGDRRAHRGRGVGAVTGFVASDQWVAANQSWPTTLWATNATISAAILRGPIVGMVAGVVVMAASAASKGYFSIDVGRNARSCCPRVRPILL